MKDFKIFQDCLNLLNLACVSQNYLNKFTQNVDVSDLKNFPCGHWGACPSINFLYLHLINFFKRHNLKANIVVGTGHAGSAVNANLWLCGELEKQNRSFEISSRGLNNLIQAFGKEIRTEINPHYPTTLFDGGELGYSLAFAYGLAIDDGLDFLPCIIGDGECETSTLSASWQLGRLTNNRKVLPIINLNGLKMCSESFLSKLTDRELKALFSSYGYKAYIAGANHKELYNALEDIYKSKDLSLIIFKSKKGFSAFENDQIKIVGKTSSHKNPLTIPNSQSKANFLKSWVLNYNINPFLDSDKRKQLISFCKYDFYVPKIKPKKFNLKTDLNCPAFKNLEINLKNLLSFNDFYILDPDELTSNKLGEVKNNKRVISLLNENVLQGLYQGLSQANINGLFVTYEAFAPIFISMVSQYLKYLTQKQQISERKNPSLNYLLTSTFPENTYSHQNPEFVASLFNKEYKNVNAYYPVGAKSLVSTLEKSLNSKDQINVITISKRADCEKFNNLDGDLLILKDSKKPDIVLCATGDYILNQLNDVSEIIELLLPEIKIKLIYISNIKVLSEKFDEGLTQRDFEELFSSNCPVIYSYMGYKSVLKNLLYERNCRFKIFGFEDRSNISGSVEKKLKYNKMGKDSIVLEILNTLLDLGKISKAEFARARFNTFLKLEEVSIK